MSIDFWFKNEFIVNNVISLIQRKKKERNKNAGGRVNRIIRKVYG